jgi:hypothetical protein
MGLPDVVCACVLGKDRGGISEIRGLRSVKCCRPLHAKVGKCCDASALVSRTFKSESGTGQLVIDAMRIEQILRFEGLEEVLVCRARCLGFSDFQSMALTLDMIVVRYSIRVLCDTPERLAKLSNERKQKCKRT